MLQFYNISKNLIISFQGNYFKAQTKKFQRINIQLDEFNFVSAANLIKVVSQLLKIQNFSVSYFNGRKSQSNYYFCGNDKSEKSYRNFELYDNQQLRLNIRLRRTLLETLCEEQKQIYPQVLQEQQILGIKKQKKISEVIRKVAIWRRYYAGFKNSKNIYTRYNSNDAAQIIQTPKKTLDDYLQQLRKAKKYGFNFQKSQALKIGVLRNFIKQK